MDFALNTRSCHNNWSYFVDYNGLKAAINHEPHCLALSEVYKYQMQLSNKSSICIYVKHILVKLKTFIERGGQKCTTITLSPLPGGYFQVTGIQYEQATASDLTLVFTENEGRKSKKGLVALRGNWKKRQKIGKNPLGINFQWTFCLWFQCSTLYKPCTFL